MIRRFQDSDIEALMELFYRAVHEGAALDYSLAQRAAWAPQTLDPTLWLQRRLSRPTWVAVVDNAIAGFSDLEPDGHIDMLYVHPEFQRRGIARALIETVQNYAYENAITHLFTEASTTARPAFEAFGFDVVAAQTVHRNGQNFINYRMQKYLS